MSLLPRGRQTDSKSPKEQEGEKNGNNISFCTKWGLMEIMVIILVIMITHDNQNIVLGAASAPPVRWLIAPLARSA